MVRRRVTRYGMVDAGCAVVLDRRRGFARLKAINAVTLPEYESTHGGPEPLYPPGATLPGKLDFGNAKNRWLDGPDRDPVGPLKLVAAHDELVGRTLDESGITPDEVTRVAYVNGSRQRVRDRAMVPLGLPMSLSRWDQGRTIGHIGAGRQIVALEQLPESGSLRGGDYFLMLGVGPGLNIACAVIEIPRDPAAGRPRRRRRAVRGRLMDFDRTAQQQARYEEVEAVARELSAGGEAGGFRRRTGRPWRGWGCSAPRSRRRTAERDSAPSMRRCSCRRRTAAGRRRVATRRGPST